MTTLYLGVSENVVIPKKNGKFECLNDDLIRWGIQAQGWPSSRTRLGSHRSARCIQHVLGSQKVK